MGLSTPLALIAAALVALPIIAHLVRRADVERRVLPTVALLRRVVVRDRRRARITEPWLLAVRIAAVIAATLALAGPFLVDRLAYGDGSALSLVLVIDDSASMARHTSNATALDDARDRARDVIRSLGDGSEIAIVLAGNPPRLLHPRSPDRDAALAALDRIRVGARRTELEAALDLASRQLASAHLAARRIVVLSDFAGREPSLDAGGSGIELELAPITSDASSANVGIASVRAVPDPLEAGAWSTTVELSAFGDDTVTSVAVRVLALPSGSGMPDLTATESAELGRTAVTIERGHGRANLRFHPPEGITAVAFALDGLEDASAFDDVRVASLHPPRASRVVLVEPAGARTARFASRALGAVPEGSGSFLVTAVDADHLAAHRAGIIDPDAAAQTDPLEDVDVLVLAGVVPTSPSALEAIHTFVEGGGGIVVAPGGSVRAIDLASIGEFLPARVGEVREASLAADAPSVVPGEGPAVLPAGPTGLESLHLRGLRALEADDALVSLRTSDGSPFLVVDETLRRAVLAVGIDDDLSDLPYRIGFVPLLASLARTLARPGSLPDRPFTAGEAPALRVAEDVEAVEVVTPSGEVVTRPIDHGRVALDDLADPGLHTIRVERAGDVRELGRAALVLVPPAEEIDLTPHVPTQRHADTTRDEDGETRVPIERFAYLLLGLLAVIEGFVRLGLTRHPSRA